jgi:pyridoxamine 5'-phosphate oxidase
MERHRSRGGSSGIFLHNFSPLSARDRPGPPLVRLWYSGLVAAPPPQLLESDVDPDPLRQFDAWYDDAQTRGIAQSDAVTLATSTRDGIPSARMVLLKGRDARGFQFFTNYESVKARELAENPRACLVFYWAILNRQIRVVGTVTKLPREDSEKYFRTRHRGSQIGAWASQQDQILSSRAELDDRVRELDKAYEGAEVPTPPHWGGYVVAPTSVEFWQGRDSRLHDRLRYTRRADGSWRIERLSP